MTPGTTRLLAQIPRCAALAALVFGILLGLCLDLASPSFAQDQAAPAAPMVQACDGAAMPPILEACSPNSGDTAWMLAAMAIVLIILKIVDIFIGLRVSAGVEREGLDLAVHGETLP